MNEYDKGYRAGLIKACLMLFETEDLSDVEFDGDFYQEGGKPITFSNASIDQLLDIINAFCNVKES